MVNVPKGALAQAVFDTADPKSQGKFEEFIAELDKVKRENNIDLLIICKKKLSDTKFEIVIIPAFGKAVDKKALQALGFDGIEVASNLSEMRTKFKEFHFSQEVSFGDKFKK